MLVLTLPVIAGEAKNMDIIKLFLGMFFLFLGFVYLYKPKFVIKINYYAKEFLFNDSYVLLRRKKIGILLVLLSLIAFFMTWARFIQ
ncbi:MAG: hypothetical protein A2474_06790 [Elusimicrobia bacterium RIFOXYC2_FULL_34_12]|nr:MAG: hypothetical protein A2474_06790 [Elusimicrobia bacterium RIFOXYC2_FULL_34_12]OGS39085.1 MAG: hypothetical protein A2551_00205 [Elusimicrobia bacterium RIFOXYD2_FULL_34_30]HAM39628.1 hypothetical protein [Elusimicrobiota bacterium]